MARSLNRRRFVKNLAGAGIAGVAGSSLLAQGSRLQLPAQRSTGTRRLPPRGEFVIRRAYLLTMDEALGDIIDGDVHVRNGEIVGVGRNLRAQGASALDGRNTIVMPGFVDTHWHMWTT